MSILKFCEYSEATLHEKKETSIPVIIARMVSIIIVVPAL